VLPPPFTREGKALRERLSFRSELSGDKKEPEMQVRYYISPADISAEKFAAVMEGHWSIENKLHWRLDVAMNEDDCRIRRGDAAELFSGIRHITVNILSANKEFKAGLSRKMHRAAMDSTSRQFLRAAGFRNLSCIRLVAGRRSGELSGQGDNFCKSGKKRGLILLESYVGYYIIKSC
jgi:predicted transposase YbfD/YdcC